MSVLINTSLAYLRQTTKFFISGDPTMIAFQRQVKVNKPGGGHDFPKITMPAQKFRFINQDVTSGMTGTSDDGIARRFTYVLLGEHDADVEINDTWVEDNIQYKIDGMIPNNGWETRCYVTGYAIEPEHG